MNCLDALRENPFLKTVPQPQLDWLAAQGECRSYGVEDVPYRPGDPIDHLYVVLEGKLQVYTLQGGQRQEIFFIDTHSLAGLLPFSRLRESRGFWQVLEPTTVLALHRDRFRELIQTQYELTEALVHQMTTRVRETTQQMQQNDKIMSLGRLSAGLAHELNNPVAAVVRSADTLREHLRATPENFKAVMEIRLTNEQVDVVNELLFERIGHRPTEGLSLLERSRREDELTDWLDDHDVPDALDLTESLVDFGFSTDDLDRVLDQTGPAHVGPVLGWLVNNLVTEKLVLDIGDASTRIATLVGSIKSYTHMDRGTSREAVRLREGLESTLTLLKHKLKEKHIQVDLRVPDDLPTVSGWPGELNQVWTNLIDNAVDAMDDGGTLRLRSELDRRPDGSAFVLTHVTDSGAGIPPDVRDKIFDPFFTTKPIGKGTGLGLDIVQGLVRHHHGSIKVDSQPGQTTFTVCLPV
jgi:signal transduction histidine kinase